MFMAACGRRAPEPPKQEAEIPFDAPDPRVNAARHLSDAEVIALEAKAEKDPKDVESRATLLVYYGAGNHPMEVRHIMLWMIRTHPEGISFHDVKQFTPVIDAAIDPEGYEEGRRVWLSRLASSHRPIPELQAAAKYFKLADATISQKLLLRVETGDEKENQLGPTYYGNLAGGPAWKYERPLGKGR